MKQYTPLILATLLIGMLSACKQSSPNDAANPTPDTAATDTRAFLELDLDRNGLYDDSERLALLEVFQSEVPELNDIITQKSMPVIQANVP